jgi:hypothetical protein
MDVRTEVPTFRLFVKHARPLASQQERTELCKLFEPCGTVTEVSSRPEWSNSLVSFARTEDAVRAKKKLQGARFMGMRLDVEFMRPTLLVVVRGFSRGTRLGVVEDLFRGCNVERFDLYDVERFDLYDEGRQGEFALIFESLADALAVAANQFRHKGRLLSFDFGNLQRHLACCRGAGAQATRGPEVSPGRERSRSRQERFVTGFLSIFA